MAVAFIASKGTLVPGGAPTIAGTTATGVENSVANIFRGPGGVYGTGIAGLISLTAIFRWAMSVEYAEISISVDYPGR